MKICQTCAAKNKFKFLPCENHKPAISPDKCKHEITSPTLTHNGADDDLLCHGCGLLLIWSVISGARA